MIQQSNYMQSAQQQQHPSHPQMYAQGQISSGPYINNQMLGNAAK